MPISDLEVPFILEPLLKMDKGVISGRPIPFEQLRLGESKWHFPSKCPEPQIVDGLESSCSRPSLPKFQALKIHCLFGSLAGSQLPFG